MILDPLHESIETQGDDGTQHEANANARARGKVRLALDALPASAGTKDELANPDRDVEVQASSKCLLRRVPHGTWRHFVREMAGTHISFQLPQRRQEHAEAATACGRAILHVPYGVRARELAETTDLYAAGGLRAKRNGDGQNKPRGEQPLSI